ncbi:MAG: glycosyltransferase [Anaerolineae bacterium]
MPEVSVNMSVYNGEVYLKAAVDSVLNQTFSDFELIIVDDGSTDRTAEILAGYTDPRIRVITQTNHGISYARNQALKASQGDFIAVMDADDESLPTRLERQVAFMRAHPEVGLLGSAAFFRDELAGRTWEYSPALTDEELRAGFVKGNPFIHTSIMMRRPLLELVGGYNEAFPFLVDYELYTRLAPHTRMANLPEPQVIRRYRMGSVSTTLRTELLRLRLRLRIHYRIFRTGKYPPYYFGYVLRPIAFALIELGPKLKKRKS